MKIITKNTCGLCGAICSASDGVIDIKVNSGDGRDAGPATLKAVLRLDYLHGVRGGIICEACKFKWLRAYITRAPKG